MQTENMERVQRWALNNIYLGHGDYSSKLVMRNLESLEERKSKACILMIKGLIDPNHRPHG